MFKVDQSILYGNTNITSTQSWNWLTNLNDIKGRNAYLLSIWEGLIILRIGRV